ncbi:MAG: DinB family protein, partial [Planctomycetota bacterium]
PRWNVEHMAGRELLFFSQIYHAIDPAIPVMDENPAQMPPDYEPQHPDWTGAEEALRVRRVREFVVRHAHLLQDLDLDERAPGSRWTPRGLLEQMASHYREHTANTVKKFELPGWPAE